MLPGEYPLLEFVVGVSPERGVNDALAVEKEGVEPPVETVAAEVAAGVSPGSLNPGDAAGPAIDEAAGLVAGAVLGVKGWELVGAELVELLPAAVRAVFNIESGNANPLVAFPPAVGVDSGAPVDGRPKPPVAVATAVWVPVGAAPDGRV